jgi:hypothetical protein
MEGSTPFEKKEKTIKNRLRSTDRSWNFWPSQVEEDDGDKPGPTGTL